MKKRVVLSAILSVLFLVLVSCGMATPTIDLNKYIKIEFEGVNTAGTATASFDETQFSNDWADKLKISSNGKKLLKEQYGDDFKNHIEGVDLSEFIVVAVSGSLDKSSGLSNGDTVKYSFSFDEAEITDFIDCKLEYKDIEKEVEGLKEPETFDPFEGVTVEFTGIAPGGRAEVKPSSSGALFYELDKKDNLSNGDTVTVKVTSLGGDINTYCLETMGKIPSATEKTFTVEGLPKYVTSLDEIPEDLLNKMKKQAEDVFESNAAKWEHEDRSEDAYRYMELKDLKYVGEYLLVSKSGDNYSHNNILTLVYEPVIYVDVLHMDKKYEDTFAYYWDISFYDILIDQEGKVVADTNAYDQSKGKIQKETGVPDGSSLKNYDEYTLPGYETMDDVYRELISKNLESYEHDDNINDVEIDVSQYKSTEDSVSENDAKNEDSMSENKADDNKKTDSRRK